MVNVLLVEDEKWVRVALRKVMEHTGLPLHVVYEAADGMMASNWLKSHEADLVMTDVRMPVMDGILLLKEIKRRRYACDVIVISGHDDFEYAREALRCGAVDYLLKPVEEEHMEACVRHWMEHKARMSDQRHAASPDVSAGESAVQRVIRYVETNSAFDLTSGEAAELVHLNPSYFCKLFRRTMEMTFTDYMTDVRMREAKRLLEHTALRVHEIAERLGFTDTAYFSNTFKRMNGQTPSDFRRRMNSGGRLLHE